jgi:hypothetical protein
MMHCFAIAIFSTPTDHPCFENKWAASQRHESGKQLGSNQMVLNCILNQFCIALGV